MRALLSLVLLVGCVSSDAVERVYRCPIDYRCSDGTPVRSLETDVLARDDAEAACLAAAFCIDVAFPMCQAPVVGKWCRSHCAPVGE